MAKKARYNVGALPDHIIERMRPEQRRELGVKTAGERLAEAEARDEKSLQMQCENLLRIRGFYPRTPDWIQAAEESEDFQGWYIHLHETKKNPILLDLLVWKKDATPLELELKVAGGKVSDCQQALIRMGGVLCWSFKEFTAALDQWTDSNNSLFESHRKT